MRGPPGRRRPGGSSADELARLAELKSQGVIDAEFQKLTVKIVQ